MVTIENDYRHRAVRRASVGLIVWVLSLAGPAGGQPAANGGFELQPATRQTLARIQDQWLQWVGAFYQNDQGRADTTTKELVAAAEQLGMSRLPDLCAGVLARAVSSAREGNSERAHWALEHAERLDPGRPETEFARAAVARTQGSYFQALRFSAAGFLRAARHDVLARLAVARLQLWLAGMLVLAMGLFLVLQLGGNGQRLWVDIAGFLRRRLPLWSVIPLTLLALFWPLALPSGVLCLALYLSVLLWGYGSTSERIVFGVGWLLLGLVPLGVAAVERKALVDLQPQMRALDNVAGGRLSGDLFTDLDALRSVLPESVAVEQFLAEVHRRLGQWEEARLGYLRVIAAEPENSAAYLGLGVHYFRKADFGKAIEHFKSAAASDPSSAEAPYNLSLAYSEKYLFEESRAALGKARRLGEPKVAAWISQQSPEKVVMADGGVARIQEIRELLYAPRTGGAVPRRLQMRRLLPLPLAFGAALLAITLHLVRRRRDGYADSRFGGAGAPDWLKVAVPGLSSAEDGRGFGAVAGACLAAAILTLPLVERLTFVVPWRFDPGHLLLVVTLFLLVLAVLALRFWASRRET
jgi:tetratricopeptide (TPR) repeat protein